MSPSPEANSLMLIISSHNSPDLAVALLIHYGFDLGGYSASELTKLWQTQYPLDWLHLAVVEALYQGRYKAVSAQQILAFWHRRGQAVYHFNMEFQRLICGKFSENFTDLGTPAYPAITAKAYSLSLPMKTQTDNYSYINSDSEKPDNLGNQEQPTEKMIPAASDTPYQPPKTLSASGTHPPIGQFTPTTSGSDSFALKLKSMSHDR